MGGALVGQAVFYVRYTGPSLQVRCAVFAVHSLVWGTSVRTILITVSC